MIKTPNQTMQRTANRPYASLLDYSKSLVIRAVADLLSR